MRGFIDLNYVDCEFCWRQASVLVTDESDKGLEFVFTCEDHKTKAFS